MSREILEQIFENHFPLDHTDGLSDKELAVRILAANGIAPKAKDSLAKLIGQACGFSDRPARRRDEAPYRGIVVHDEQATSDDVLDLWFHGRQVEPPSTLHIGLFTSLPSIEVTGNNYRRVVMPVGDVWTEVEDGQLSNIVPVVFNRAGSIWGRVVGVGVWDQDNDLKVSGPVTDIVDIQMGDRYIIPEGNLVIRRQ